MPDTKSRRVPRAMSTPRTGAERALVARSRSAAPWTGPRTARPEFEVSRLRPPRFPWDDSPMRALLLVFLPFVAYGASGAFVDDLECQLLIAYNLETGQAQAGCSTSTCPDTQERFGSSPPPAWSCVLATGGPGGIWTFCHCDTQGGWPRFRPALCSATWDSTIATYVCYDYGCAETAEEEGDEKYCGEAGYSEIGPPRITYWTGCHCVSGSP